MAEFANLLAMPKSLELEEVLSGLRYRSQVYVFITLNKNSITADQWIYFPARDMPFGRISEMKNFSSFMSPAGTTSLFVELFCFEGDAVWKMSEKDVLDYILPHFEKIGLFSRAEIRNHYVIRQKNVYPIYDLSYKEHLAVIKKYLNEIPGLFFIGRPGRFRYNNQDHSLEMGILAAKSIIDGKKYDIEEVGSEAEYYEKGELRVSEKQKISFNWLVLEDRDKN